MGFDGLPLGSFMIPQLSTVFQCAQMMAQRSMEILVDRIENGGEPCHEFGRYSLLQRESTRRIDE
jgi:DNA-binding LacI/PurR family transcriptional regulator